MTITAADIKAMPSGEFAALADATVNGYIAEAMVDVSADVWGDRYDSGVKYLTAHLIACDKMGATGPSGPVVSSSAGGLSRSYASGQPSLSSTLAATSYGRRYLELCRLIAGPLVT